MSHESIKSISEAYKSMHINESLTQEQFPEGVYFDERMQNWSFPRGAMQVVTGAGYPFLHHVIGVAGDATKEMLLLKPNEITDRSLVKSIRLKEGEFVARYISEATIAGGMTPFIKVSLLRKMVYPLTEESSSGETDDIRFESRGQRVQYIRVLMDFAVSELGVA